MLLIYTTIILARINEFIYFQIINKRLEMNPLTILHKIYTEIIRKRMNYDNFINIKDICSL